MASTSFADVFFTFLKLRMASKALISISIAPKINGAPGKKNGLLSLVK